jgi:uncharacterized phage-associated protein
MEEMNNNAISIANYFIDKSNSDPNSKYPLTLLRLVKYVYIAYGFALAILKKKIIDERFDKVEAWKYGPVIPSVYHTFKHNKNNPISEKSSIPVFEEDDGKLLFREPKVEDKEIISLLDFVWDRYKDKSITELIELLHRPGTPWEYCYREGENVEIHDEMTKIYYESIVENALKS